MKCIQPNLTVRLKSENNGRHATFYLCPYRNITFHEIALAFHWNRNLALTTQELMEICNEMRGSGQSQCFKSPHDKFRKNTQTLEQALSEAQKLGLVQACEGGTWYLTDSGNAAIISILQF